MAKTEKKKYYLVEIPAENAKIISTACEIMAYLLTGKLDELRVLVINAIERRTGDKATEATIEQIDASLKTLQYIGWDSTYGSKKAHEHGFSFLADALYDIMEVLNYQMGSDNIEPYNDKTKYKYPMHWNDDIPLCRIIRTSESVYNRNKQLAIFPNEK